MLRPTCFIAYSGKGVTTFKYLEYVGRLDMHGEVGYNHPGSPRYHWKADYFVAAFIISHATGLIHIWDNQYRYPKCYDYHMINEVYEGKYLNDPFHMIKMHDHYNYRDRKRTNKLTRSYPMYLISDINKAYINLVDQGIIDDPRISI